MVTGNIKTADYMFATSNAGMQTQNKSQTDFADSVNKARENYNSSVKNTSQIEKKENVKDFSGRTNETQRVQTDEKFVEKKDDSMETEKIIKAVENMVNPQVQPEEVTENEQMAQAIFGVISQKLQVSVEEIQTSMMNLNMDISDLQEPQNLLKLILDVKQLKGPEELLTDPQLTDAFKDLGAELRDIFHGLPEGGDMSETVSAVNESISVKSEEQETMTEDGGTNADGQAQENVQTQAVQNDNILNSSATSSANEVFDKVQQLLVERVDAETSENIVRQVTEQIKFNIKTDVTSMQMQLYPEHLGKVAIQVVSKNGVLTAQIAAENEAARAALESQLNTLRECFDNQGLKVESVEVMVSSRGFDQNSDTHDRSDNNHKNGRRVRKSLLSDIDGQDGDVKEEENLKETLGNTVSYTA